MQLSAWLHSAVIGVPDRPRLHKPSLSCRSDLRRLETTSIQPSQRPPEGRKVRDRGEKNRAHPPILVHMQPSHCGLSCRAGGECVSCNCISFVVIWTEFVCLCPFFSLSPPPSLYEKKKKACT